MEKVQEGVTHHTQSDKHEAESATALPFLFQSENATSLANLENYHQKREKCGYDHSIRTR